MRFVAIPLIFALYSCTKTVNVDIPPHQSKPVLSSIIQPDSLVTVLLSKTQSIFDTKSPKINNANVILYENNAPIDTLVFDKNTFNSDITPTIGKNYRITADIPNFEIITSEDVIPQKPTIKPISFEDNISMDIEGFPISRAQIEINDTSAERNYYALSLKAKFLDSDVPYLSSVYFIAENNDPIFENEGLLSYYPDELLFSDELFNQKKHTLSIDYQGFYDEDNYQLIVTVKSISKNYYNYKKALVKHLDSQYQDVWDGFGNPIAMYSNVTNGYGVFAGYSKVTDTIFKK